MRLNRTTFIVIALSILLSACSMTNLLPLSNESTQITSPLLQYVAGSLQYAPYTIFASTSADPAQIYTITIDVHYNIHIIEPRELGGQEFIYTVDNQTYFKRSADEPWLKLTVSKHSLAKDLLAWNVLSWTDEQLSQSYVEMIDDPQCNSCLQYKINSDDLSLLIDIDNTTGHITTIKFNQQEISYSFEYHYNVQEISIPDNYQEFSIPSDPTESDIETIQDIYGTN